jgi:predicted amidohydrolase/ribosomal protein S18 acetylase RimI-like enzyme
VDQPSKKTLNRNDIIIRPARDTDVPALVDLDRAAFPEQVDDGTGWEPRHLDNHIRIFPQGQIVAELEGQIIGACSSLIVDMGADPYRPHTYHGITDSYFFYTHNPQGDTLYGAAVCTHPEFRGLGIGHLLYEARRELCRKMNLRRILAGGRLADYARQANGLSLEDYVRKVEYNELRDQVLSFQLREGFVVRGILRDYMVDPASGDAAALIEWQNPNYIDRQSHNQKIRVACVQYSMRGVESFEQFAEYVEHFMDTACDYRADFVVFPEFFSVQLLSQPSLRGLTSLEGIRKLAEFTDQFLNLMSRLAKEYGLHIVAGSHPIPRGLVLENVCPFFFPDGTYVVQPKLHITPSEKRHWGITGGNELRVIQTAKAKIGILICYDAEFPETARYLADNGAEVIFVPYCTDDRQGYLRVKNCCQARAIENQVYVVTSGVIGNLPSVPAMDIHYARAGVYSPSDFEFARDGVQAEADSNVEMLLVTDLDIDDIHRSRSAGSVTPYLDRRRDLFTFQASFPGPTRITTREDAVPPTSG